MRRRDANDPSPSSGKAATDRMERTLPHIHFDTDTLAPHAATQAWQEISRPLFHVEPMESESSPQLRGRIDAYLLSDWMLGTIRCSPHRYWREAALLTDDGLDYYFIQLYTEGHLSGECHGAESLSAKPGDLVFLDLKQALTLRATAMACLALVVPRRELAPDSQAQRDSLHGLVVPASDPLNRVTRAFLETLITQLPSLSEKHVNRIQSSLRDLLCSGSDLIDCPPRRGQAPGSLRKRLHAYIECHLASTKLTPASLQEAFHVSRTTLYRAFGKQGISDFIRHRRLDAALRDLCQHPQQPISQVAERWGFTSERQFQRAFRQRFDMTPTQALAQRDRLLEANSDVKSVREALAKYMSQP